MCTSTQNHIRRIRSIAYNSHVNYVKPNWLKALDILKVVAHADWGADQKKKLLCLYRALVRRSKLEYGCIVYGEPQTTFERNWTLSITKACELL